LFYKGYCIERVWYNGFYVTLSEHGRGYLKADTIGGIKQLINEEKS